MEQSSDRSLSLARQGSSERPLSSSSSRKGSFYKKVCLYTLAVLFLVVLSVSNIYVSTTTSSSTTTTINNDMPQLGGHNSNNHHVKIMELERQLNMTSREAQMLKREFREMTGLKHNVAASIQLKTELKRLRKKWRDIQRLKKILEKQQQQQGTTTEKDDDASSTLEKIKSLGKLIQKLNGSMSKLLRDDPDEEQDEIKFVLEPQKTTMDEIQQTLEHDDKKKKNKDNIKKRDNNKKSDHHKKKKNKKKKPMNILLLYADDWRYDTLGIAGNAVVKTPTLDKLAQEGIRFRENCVTTSICWCSRATLFSGLYTTRHNTTLPNNAGYFERTWRKSLYQLLKRAGYWVGHVGKWGVWFDFDTKIHFDVEEDGWHYEERDGRWWQITEKNQHDALEFLEERDKDKPFFLNVAFFATHAVDDDPKQYIPQNSSMGMYVHDTVPIPQTATEESWQRMPHFFDEGSEGRVRWHWRFDSYEKHQRMMKNYYRMATEVDSASAAIMEEIERQGELDNTLIIFTTDNGNFHAEHGLADKWFPHQESIRVPLIIKDPRMPVDKAGTVNDDFTLNIDLAPTILSAAGLEPPRSMMGRDMSELYMKKDDDTTKWRQEFFYEFPSPFPSDYIPSSEALVRKDYKYMLWPDFGLEQLFDLRSDPIEDNDIVNSTKDEHKDVLKEMRSRFNELKRIVHGGKHVTL